uniref:Palladin, cytoskeletal associated protein n=1 Tax=Callorhinchus milii TaxID=7868 RepID=A0A4W3JR25_CALMI
MSEASSHDMYFDSLSDFQEDGADGAELSAFLTQEEMSKSLDLAREAFEDSLSQEATLDAELENVSNCFQHYPSVTNPAIPETKAVSQPDCPQPSVSRTAQEISTSSKHMGSADDSHRAAIPRHPLLDQSHRPDLGRDGLAIGNFHASGMSVPHKENTTTDPKGNQKCVYQSESSARNEFRSKAVSFIEELSSIFRTVRPRSLETETGKSIEEDNSSPDSGYLSPKSHAKATSAATEQSKSSEAKLQVVADLESRDETEQSWAMDQTTAGDLHASDSAPRFIQKLKSQEVAEGSTVRLECRVTGNPSLLIRWFCEDKELQNSPDIQIFQNGDLYSLIIAEAFEDDTGRYTCLATNHLGSDTTSAEVYIEGMLVCEAFYVMVIAIVELRLMYSGVLQDISAFDGQVVVLECRIKGAPLVRVQWFRQGTEIEDSPDFRILQKKPRSASEPEEICTLVIAETFPEDAGIFTCVATNHLGSVSCRAELTLHTGTCEDAMDNGTGLADNHTVSPQTEISSLQLPPKRTIDHVQVNSLEIKPSVAALQLQLNTAEKEPNGTSSHQATNGLNQEQPTALPSPIKEPPPLLTKPKLLKKQTRAGRLATDEEIQGTKNAVIQDLERKLRFKDDRLSNGQKLTYEEKMARRLLGADSAATVFSCQETEEEPVAQEYKVSTFEQRLISEIEFRLERSQVDESDDEVQHDEQSAEGMVPMFEKKLKHVKLFEGMPITIACKVTGEPMPKVYWFKDGKQISKRSEHYKIHREGDGTCSLSTEAATLDDDGNYTIMLANPLGRTSCTARLMVQTVSQRGRSPRSPLGQSNVRRPRSRSRDSGEEPESIQERFFRPHFLQAPGDMIVQEGKLCRMDCKVSGLPTPDLIWQLNGNQIHSDANHKMLVRENGIHSLVIEPVTAKDAGIYTCIATNRAGQNFFNLELLVAAKEMVRAPVFIEKLQNTGVAEGYPVRLECRVSGVPYPQIFWKKDNESLTQNTERVSIHHDNKGYICLLIQPTTKEDAAWYTVSAKNEAGIISCTAKLDVLGQFVFFCF